MLGYTVQLAIDESRRKGRCVLIFGPSQPICAGNCLGSAWAESGDITRQSCFDGGRGSGASIAVVNFFFSPLLRNRKISPFRPETSIFIQVTNTTSRHNHDVSNGGRQVALLLSPHKKEVRRR